MASHAQGGALACQGGGSEAYQGGGALACQGGGSEAYQGPLAALLDAFLCLEEGAGGGQLYDALVCVLPQWQVRHAATLSCFDEYGAVKKITFLF